MKKIIFLLLFTITSYGQAVFDEGIQITGNANSGTATKVNVQEANGKVNTQTINTGFNKNIGLGGSDVVGANTLLNQYSTTPIDWTATTFASGQVVFYGGKQWIAKMATVAGDVPAVSSKWDEITFEALAVNYAKKNIAYVDVNGNNTTGVLGNIRKAFLTIDAALDALPASGGIIKIGLGSFNSPKPANEITDISNDSPNNFQAQHLKIHGVHLCRS